MKYLIKNKANNEEHLCEKVTSSIYGFDLYLDENMDAVADNNPSSTLPKVIDEAEELARDTVNNHSSLKTDSEKAIGFTSFYEGYNKHAETHPNSDVDMVEFSNYTNLNYSFTIYGGEPKYKDKDGIRHTPDEVLNLWKSQQPQVIYYE